MKVLVAIFAYNEGKKIKQTVNQHPGDRQYDLLIMDDGSTDGSTFSLGRKLPVLRNRKNQGIGAAMKRVFRYALDKKYDILVIQAGNNKDNPRETPRLLAPLVTGKADFVQGSRFLPGGNYTNTPFHRIIATRFIHPLLFSLAVGKRLTDTTNGFRAFSIRILQDNRLDWKQNWLNKYELEPYLLFKVIKLGYRHLEVPVSKIYPARQQDYTKMKPFFGWWSILRPIFYLWLGFKK